MKENLNTISREELEEERIINTLSNCKYEDEDLKKLEAINILLQKTLKIKYPRNKIPGFFRNR